MKRRELLVTLAGAALGGKTVPIRLKKGDVLQVKLTGTIPEEKVIGRLTGGVSVRVSGEDLCK